jgi:hypothetical protein
LPDNFHWGNGYGVSYLTHSPNQHIPQWFDVVVVQIEQFPAFDDDASIVGVQVP